LKTGYGISSLGGDKIGVNTIHRLLPANITGILKGIKVTSEKRLFEYVDENNSLKVYDLLTDLKIDCDEGNKDELLKIWKFMVSQSKTCLQGSSFYSFNFFVKKIIELYEGKSLNSSALWNSICKEIHYVFKGRKERAFFENDGKFFSLRMFSTNKKFSEDQIKFIRRSNNNANLQTTETEAAMMVKKSIDYHFYHFGDEDSPSVIQFGHNEVGLTLKNSSYKARSHILPFEKDSFTSFALWKNYPIDDNNNLRTVALNAQNYMNCLEAKSAKYSAAQEIITYWSIANASHQNFDGKTKGVDFFRSVLKNIRILDYSDLYELNRLRIPEKLASFLNTLTIPYLLPEEPSNDLKSTLSGLCDFGVAYKCAIETGMDVGFDVRRNDKSCHAFIQCKCIDDTQGNIEIEPYIKSAKSKNSVLTFLFVLKGHDNINFDLAKSVQYTKPTTRDRRSSTLNLVADDSVAGPASKKAKKDFKLNIYSLIFTCRDEKDIIFKGNGKNLSIKIIEEHENPDGVLIIL
jgi:hypothetical protein